MKNLYWSILTIILVLFIIVISLFNTNNISEITLFAIKTEISTHILILANLFIGVISGLLFMLQFVLKKGDSLKAYERRLEKTSVSNDASSAKIKVLESKIQVLEKALDDALKNK